MSFAQTIASRLKSPDEKAVFWIGFSFGYVRSRIRFWFRSRFRRPNPQRAATSVQRDTTERSA